MMKEKIPADIKKWMEEGYSGRSLASRYTSFVDAFVAGIFHSFCGNEQLVLLATGGYGRGELAPFSDIDIMFFAKDRANAATAERILYALWDSGLEISHAFRTADECIEEAFKDIRTRTSLLESRYITGDAGLYATFRNDIYPVVAHKNKKAFVREKLGEMEKRHLKSGDSVFLLEPHIKEGEGSLRDIHTVLWLLRVSCKLEKLSDLSSFMSEREYRNLLKAYDFMIQMRYCLHLDSGRRNDILAFEYQKSVARCLGFTDSKKFSGPERMMRYYYLKSRIIKDVTRRTIAMCSSQYASVFRNFSIRKLTDDFSVSAGRLIATKQGLLETNSDKIMEVFYLFSRTGGTFSDTVKENIKTRLLHINGKARRSSAAIHFFLEIFKSTRVHETLRLMHEAGVLGRFVPEFGALRCLVVHEPYHMYTVDEHTLLAVKNLENLKSTKYGHLEELREIINSLENLDLLYLALLFHDIGKAVGKHHEEEGYRRLKNILDRFNLESRKRGTIEFLVKNHILMAKLAMTRETSDMDVIARFAESVESLENLKALYLITYADMSAVNPQFWTSWKAYLLRDLYLATRDYMSGIKKSRTEYVRGLQALSPAVKLEEVVRFVDEMPERYLLLTPGAKVIADYELRKKAAEEFFSMRIDTRADGIAEVVICTKDSPGLFSGIVGYLSSKGLNIFSGDIFTGRNGIVIDKISIANWKELWWEGLGREIESGLRGVIIDENPVTFVGRCRETHDLFDLFIELDNETSNTCSIVEIFAQDRLGLLYDISKVMHQKGLNIISARIHTESGLAQDIFYVQAENRKIADTLIEELLSELWTLLKK